MLTDAQTMVQNPPLRPFPDHRDPHSFPTRRSSDLAVAPINMYPDIDAHLRRAPSHVVLGETREMAFDWRSEEHTSELQSRRELVCRLLLEKKKQTELHDLGVGQQPRRSRHHVTKDR